MIPSTREVEVMTRAEFFAVESGARADVAHRVSAAAEGTDVGRAAVNQSSVVQAGAIGLQLNRNHSALVALRGLDLGSKNILLRIDRFIVARSVQRPRDDVHAPVFPAA